MDEIKIVLVKTKSQANEAYDLTLEMIATMGYDDNPLRDVYVGNVLENTDKVMIFLAEVKGVAVGVATVAVNFDPYGAGFNGFLKGMFVVPTWRRRGVADALFVGIKKEVKRRGLLGLIWWVHDDNEASLNFFEKHKCLKSNSKYHMFKESVVTF